MFHDVAKQIKLWIEFTIESLYIDTHWYWRWVPDALPSIQKQKYGKNRITGLCQNLKIFVAKNTLLSARKMILILFVDTNGVILENHITIGITVNSVTYCELLNNHSKFEVWVYTTSYFFPQHGLKQMLCI